MDKPEKIVVFYTISVRDGDPSLRHHNPRSALLIHTMREQDIRGAVFRSTLLIQPMHCLESVIPVPLFDIDQNRRHASKCWRPMVSDERHVPQWARLAPWVIGIGSGGVAESEKVLQMATQLLHTCKKWVSQTSPRPWGSPPQTSNNKRERKRSTLSSSERHERLYHALRW